MAQAAAKAVGLGVCGVDLLPGNTVVIGEVNPTVNALWAQFEVDPYMTYFDVAQGDQMESMFAWQQQLATAAGLEWLRKPFRPGQ